MPRRRTRLALTRSLRGLMALLWLAASLAYLTRDQTVLTGTMVMGPGSALTNLMSGSVPLGSAADAHVTDQMEMPAGPPGADQGASRQAKSAPTQGRDLRQTHRANAPPAPSAPSHHAGHCPFCFTAAFALEAVAVASPPVQSESVPTVTVWPASAPRLSVADFDARAPPFPA
ncbi:hypothetical protein [Deinococcus sp.]|uniref:hypothetical protein n=1 Tax=Deinococcus sp. TaxID=47478 RepID=UPI0025E960EB|nr:hypothetical protein [Deinococcus sp.]